mgnify:FL=1
MALLVAGVAGYVWLTDLPDPMPEAVAATSSDDLVTVTDDPWLTFTPAEPSAAGLVFYPGGRVPPEAYAPALQAIAEAGYTTVVPDMPFGLAVLSPDVANEVIEAHPEVERWVIGGHSLGGAMAASYADGHDTVDGLALWAAYPADTTDLSDDDLTVASIYATEDGLTTLEDIEDSRARLPADTTFTEIVGGNHAGFGWYGEQDGDGVATISREQQQAQTVAATLDVLRSVETETD